MSRKTKKEQGDVENPIHLVKNSRVNYPTTSAAPVRGIPPRSGKLKNIGFYY